jgi:hypothetical protein
LLPSGPTIHIPNGGVLTDYTPPNLIDASPPTNYTIGQLTPGIPGSTEPPGSGNNGGGSLATTGLPFELPMVALGLVGAAVLLRRHRRAHSATR